MPGELKPLVRGWQHERRNGVDLWRWRFRWGGEWIAACAGAGVEAATRAFAEAEKLGPVSRSSPPAGREPCARSLRPARPIDVSGRHRCPHRGAFVNCRPESTRRLLAGDQPKVADAEPEKQRLACHL
jgi:hypothetical protein